MIRCFIRLKQLDAAQDLADGLDASVKSPELEAAKTALKLALDSQNAPDPDDLKQKAEQNPDDLQVKYDYARALFAAGQAEQAIDQLIEIIKTEREWNNDAARQQLFQILRRWDRQTR